MHFGLNNNLLWPTNNWAYASNFLVNSGIDEVVKVEGIFETIRESRLFKEKRKIDFSKSGQDLAPKLVCW